MIPIQYIEYNRTFVQLTSVRQGIVGSSMLLAQYKDSDKKPNPIFSLLEAVFEEPICSAGTGQHSRAYLWKKK
jgi:hypothetical protein